MELDIVLSGAGGYFPAEGEDFVPLARSIPAEWQSQWSVLLGKRQRLVCVLELAAGLADVLLGEDYSRVMLAVRELTVEAALARMTDQANALGLAVNTDLPPTERLADLWAHIVVETYADLGFKVTLQGPRARRQRGEMERVARILAGGDLHSRFWHWVDRLYYQWYRPWRQPRTETLDMLERKALTALGARQKSATPPETAWLPVQSPLLRHPELLEAVDAGSLHVFFWVEPFSLMDWWSLRPGLLSLSFAHPGALYQGFQDFAADVSDRVKALADPTRLTILRIIRHFGMINTEIAQFLELARPTVSVHAKILREAGLIRSHRQGRVVRHEIVPEEVRRLFRDLERFLDLPDDAED
jgi:DNA-binding transcriptional ArsR family regulator